MADSMADSITDDQIRELLTEADAKRDRALHSDPVDQSALVEWGPVVRYCEIALGLRRSTRKGGKQHARSRVSEILNRAKEAQ